MRAALDAQGRPLFEPSLQAGDPDRFMGKPIVVDYDMATVAAGNTVAAFGDFRQAFWVRNVGGLTISVSDDRYFEYRQTGVVALETIDSGLVNTQAVKVMKVAAV